MDTFDASEFSTLSFESEFESFLDLQLPANGDTAAINNGGTTTANNVSPYRQGFGQPGGKDTQCPGCAKYKLDLDRISHEHKINFQLLKKKIINTDLVLRKWKEQKDECDLLRAETEESKRKLDQAIRDSEILSQQLSTAMSNIKPMQEEKEHLKAQLELKSRQVIELNDRIEGDVVLKSQRTAQDEYNKTLENEVTKLKKTTSTLTAKTRSLESKIKDLASDKNGLTCTKHVLERRLDNMAVALHTAQAKCQSYWEQLKQHDTATRDRKPTFIPNGLKSIVRRAVDKKNGIFTDPTRETANQAASGDDDDVSLHSDAKIDNSDLDNISDLDSEGDSDNESWKRVVDNDGPSQPAKDVKFSATFDSAVISHKHQSPRKQVESDVKTIPQLKNVSQMLPRSSAENIPQKLLPKLNELAGGHRDIEDTACKLSNSKQAPSAEHSWKPKEREIGSAPSKDMEISQKLPETVKLFSKDIKKEYSSNLSNRSKENSIISNKSKVGQVNRTNLNQNNKNGDVDSLDDSSLSSLSSLSSSDDDSNDIDMFLNFGSTSDYNKEKRRNLDLDTAFSFAEIESLLSPLSVSPRPGSSLSSRSVSPVSPRPASPLSPHPVPLLPQQAVSKVSSPPRSDGSPVSSLASVDSNDEGNTSVDCLFTRDFASSQSQPAPHGDNRGKLYASDNSNMNSVKAGAIKHVESVFRDGGYQNVIVSRSQSVGFTPATNDAGDICGLDVADDSISDSVSGVAILGDLNISKDVSEAKPLTGSHMLGNISNNAALVDRSDSEYSSNNAAVMDHSISENICNDTMGTDRSVTDNISNMDTCVEIYILKNVPFAELDKLNTKTEVADTCDNKSVIKITQASDTELVLSQMNQSLQTHAWDLRSPLSQTHKTLDTVSLDLKSPPPLPQTHQHLDTMSLDLKLPQSLSQTHPHLDTVSLELKSSPPLTQTHPHLDTVSLKSPPPLTQTHPHLDTVSLDLKSPPPLTQTHPHLDTVSLDFKSSPPLTQTHPHLNTVSLDLKSSPPLTQTHPHLDTVSLDLKSPPHLTQTHPHLDAMSLDLKSSPPLTQTHLNLDIVSLEKQNSSNIETLELKSSITFPPNHLSLNTQASNMISSSSLPPKDQSLNSQFSVIKSLSTVPQMHQSLNMKDSDITSSLVVPEMHQSLNMQQPGIHQSINMQTSDIKSSAVPQIDPPLNTQTLDIKSSPVPQIHPPLNTQTLDIKSPPAVPLMHQPLSKQDADTMSSPAMPQMHQSPDTASDIKSSAVPQIHPPLNTQTLDIKSSAVPQIHPPLNRQTLDIKSSAVPQIHPPLNTQTLDIKSSAVPQIHPPLNTQTLDIKSPPAVPLMHQPLSKQDADTMSSPAMPQMHQSPDTASDIKSSAVPQIHPPLNTQTLDIKSSAVPQIHPPLNTQTLDIKSSAVPQIHPPLNIQTLDIKSPPAVPLMHQPLSKQDADTMSSPAMPQMHQSPDTASDITSSSVLPQRHQMLLLDVFNFFNLPPLLSPLPPSPRPHQLAEDLPLAKFNSAAPANIQKVTPHAQVERKAASGKNSSMSSQIIEARKLMAKRKAAVLAQSVAVTNRDKRKRTSIVAEISPAVSAKRRKLANLSGFPNANAAVMYDLRQFLTAKDLDLKMAAETMLSRVVEGNTKAVWEILCQVTVNYLQSTHEDELIHLVSACEKEGIIDTVFIREDERRLVLLISAFWRLDESLDRRRLMGMIWTAIFNQGCSNQLVRLSFCRMFTSLCLEQGDLEQVRILVYSIAWCDYLDLVHPLMVIVGVWPQLLDHSYKFSECCIKNVLRFMLKEKCKADSSLLHKVTLVLQRVCQFDMGKRNESPENLLKNLLQLMERQVVDGIGGSKLERTFETMKTIELLLVYQGPEWTEKHFTMSIMVSSAMKWENKRPDKAGPPDQFITCLFKIFRAVVAVQSQSLSAVGMVLGTVFPRFLNSTTGDTSMMATCIDALLDLAPFSPDKCLDILKKWQATQSNIPAETLSKLQQVQTMFSKKAPPKKQKGRKQKKSK